MITTLKASWRKNVSTIVVVMQIVAMWIKEIRLKKDTRSGRPKISSNPVDEVADNRKGLGERPLRSSHPTYDRNACIVSIP